LEEAQNLSPVSVKTLEVLTEQGLIESYKCVCIKTLDDWQQEKVEARFCGQADEPCVAIFVHTSYTIETIHAKPGEGMENDCRNLTFRAWQKAQQMCNPEEEPVVPKRKRAGVAGTKKTTPKVIDCGEFRLIPGEIPPDGRGRKAIPACDSAYDPVVKNFMKGSSKSALVSSNNGHSQDSMLKGIRYVIRYYKYEKKMRVCARGKEVWLEKIKPVPEEKTAVS